jgi:hypothetical protein
MPKRAPASQATPEENTGTVGTAAKDGLSLLPHVSQAEMELILSQWRKITPYYFKTTSEKEKELFTEYLKFMVIKATTTSAVCPSQQIDHIWHSHIICTREYAAFCARIGQNGQFLHHSPSDGLTSQQVQYANTVQRYSELGFGSIADHPDFWEPSSSVSAFVNPVRPEKKARVDTKSDETEEDVPAKAPAVAVPAANGSKAARKSAPAVAVPAANGSKAARKSAPAVAVPAANGSKAARKSAPAVAVPAANGSKAARKSAPAVAVPAANGSKAAPKSTMNVSHYSVLNFVMEGGQLVEQAHEEPPEPTPLEDRPLFKQTDFPVKAPSDPTRPVRHLRTFVDLVKEGIFFASKPYSKKQENGLYRLTTKKYNAIYGPGSNRNALYHCRRCDCLWHLDQDHAEDDSYKTFDVEKWAKDHKENDEYVKRIKEEEEEEDDEEEEEEEEDESVIVLSDGDESGQNKKEEDYDLLKEWKYCVYCSYKCSNNARPTISCCGCG